jgi:3-deoxy-7-phosphoheptulonate synthase
MCKASVAAGADGLILEVHEDPRKAMSDGSQTITPAVFQQITVDCGKIAAVIDR